MIEDLYQNVFGRNPDQEGLKYRTGAGGEGMSLADIEASFKGSAEQKLRDNVSGTNNFVSTDDYIDAKQANNTGGGNTTITQTSAGNNDAGVTTTGQSSTSNAADNWLQDFYTTTGINEGNLDAAAKTYWEGEAAKLGKDKVKDIIRGTARAEGTLA